MDLLIGPYRGFFQHIVVLCPTVRYNKTYQQRPWIWKDPEVYVLDPGERLHNYLKAFYQAFMGEPILYIIDDCSATKALTKKKDVLSGLAFSGRHAVQSDWVFTQKCNSVLKDLREQMPWVALENDVISSREQRALVRQQLAETKHAKLLLKDQPAAYMVLSNVKL